MSQRIAIFDLDGTLFRWQLYHELVFELKTQGAFDEDTAEKLDTALVEWQAKQRSWHSYEAEIIQALEPRLPNLPVDLLERAAHAVVARSGHKIYNYTKHLLDHVKQDGYFTLAISGSQQEIAEPFAQNYGFDECIGALYHREDGLYTGAVARRVPGRKHEIIQEFMTNHPSLTLKDSIAIGDSDGDISMLELVAAPIAFNPSADLLTVAMERQWRIVIERKNIAYTLQSDPEGLYVLDKTTAYSA